MYVLALSPMKNTLAQVPERVPQTSAKPRKQYKQLSMQLQDDAVDQ